MPGMMRLKARGRPKQRERGSMNGIEREYSELLQARKLAGEIADWAFEAENLRLADLTYYRPDFRVMLPDGSIQFHETKAMTSKGAVLFEDDARVKIKVAAEQHWMYQFVGAYRRPKKSGGGWKFETF